MDKTFVDRPNQTVVMLGRNDNLNNLSELDIDTTWLDSQSKNLTVDELSAVINALTETRTRKIFGV